MRLQVIASVFSYCTIVRNEQLERLAQHLVASDDLVMVQHVKHPVYKRVRPRVLWFVQAVQSRADESHERSHKHHHVEVGAHLLELHLGVVDCALREHLGGGATLLQLDAAQPLAFCVVCNIIVPFMVASLT